MACSFWSLGGLGIDDYEFMDFVEKLIYIKFDEKDELNS